MQMISTAGWGMGKLLASPCEGRWKWASPQEVKVEQTRGAGRGAGGGRGPLGEEAPLGVRIPLWP